MTKYFGLEASDYDRFHSQGFELVKSSIGRFYIRPIEHYRMGNLTKSQQIELQNKAISAGFVFDHIGNIVDYKKKENENNGTGTIGD